MTFAFKNKIYYTYEGSLAKVNSFSDDIIYQCGIILSELITYRECMILVNIYLTYNMAILFTNAKFTFPRKDEQGHL